MSTSSQGPSCPRTLRDGDKCRGKGIFIRNARRGAQFQCNSCMKRWVRLAK